MRLQSVVWVMWIAHQNRQLTNPPDYVNVEFDFVLWTQHSLFTFDKGDLNSSNGQLWLERERDLMDCMVWICVCVEVPDVACVLFSKKR